MSEPAETVLDEHLAAENAHDLDRIMATYTASPVIELNGARIEGPASVREFHRGFGFGGDAGASFSDVRVVERRRHRTPAAIILEQTLTAVHTVYLFEGSKLAQENVYLDEGRVRHLLTRSA